MPRKQRLAEMEFTFPLHGLVGGGGAKCARNTAIRRRPGVCRRPGCWSFDSLRGLSAWLHRSWCSKSMGVVITLSIIDQPPRRTALRDYGPPRADAGGGAQPHYYPQYLIYRCRGAPASAGAAGPLRLPAISAAFIFCSCGHGRRVGDTGVFQRWRNPPIEALLQQDSGGALKQNLNSSPRWALTPGACSVACNGGCRCRCNRRCNCYAPPWARGMSVST